MAKEQTIAISSRTIFFLPSRTSEPFPPPPLTTVAVVTAASLMGMEACLCRASLSSPPSEGEVMEIVTAASSLPSVPPFEFISLRAMLVL